jgi:hypothetical protein
MAALTAELSAIGAALGLGELGVISLKAPSAARVFSRRASAVLAIEIDPRCAVGPVELKLLTLAWAPEDVQRLALQRAPTGGQHTRGSRTSSSVSPSGRQLRQTSRPTSTPIELPVLREVEPSRNATSGVLPGPVFAGDLDEFGIPDLLEFLRSSQRTGLLTCTSRYGIGTVRLSRGMIVGASSPNALDLREHLLSSPDLAAEQRRAVAALPIEAFREDNVTSAVSHDLVARVELERAHLARIQSVVREMIGWTSGRFSFDPGAPVMPTPALGVSSQSILLRIYQERDDQTPQ